MNRREFLTGAASSAALGLTSCTIPVPNEPMDVLHPKGPVPGENLADGYRHDLVIEMLISPVSNNGDDKSVLSGQIALTERLMATGNQVVDSNSYEALGATLQFLKEYPTKYDITGAGATPIFSTKSSAAALEAYMKKVTVAEPEPSSTGRVGKQKGNALSR